MCGKSKTSIYNVLKRKKISPEYANIICKFLDAKFSDFFILSSCTKEHNNITKKVQFTP